MKSLRIPLACSYAGTHVISALPKIKSGGGKVLTRFVQPRAISAPNLSILAPAAAYQVHTRRIRVNIVVSVWVQGGAGLPK